MKIRLDRGVLAEAVQWVARSLPTRAQVPILTGLLINTTGNTVVFSSFDYETSARLTLNAEVTDEGVALVSGRLLADIARNLPNKTVYIDTNDSRMELVCGSARFTLQTMPVSDYPSMPAMPQSAGTIEAGVLAKAVSQVQIAAGRDELLPVFTGVRLEFAGELLSLLATDRYRMALKEISWRPADPSVSGAALVPAKVLGEASKSMTPGFEVSINLSNAESGEGSIGFVSTNDKDTREITTRLLDGEFPKVRHLMNVKASVSVRANTQEIMAAVKRVALVAERNTSLRMGITPDAITLSAATGDQAQASEALEAVVTDHTGAGLTLTAAGFNPHYLQDALNALDAPYVNFDFSAAGKPCLLMGLDDLDGEPREDYKHVIMLMRLPQ